MNERGFLPWVDMVWCMVQLLLVKHIKASSCEPTTIGINLARKFINQYETIKSKYRCKYDYEWMQCENPEVLNAWFRYVQTIIVKYSILTEDIYNFDKTDFQIIDAITANVISSTHMNCRLVITH